MSTPKILIAIFLLIVCKTSFCQQLNKTEREYFVLGTLTDYNGRNLDPRNKNLIDRYDASQNLLITAIDSLLQIDYPVSSYQVKRHLDSAGNLLDAKIFSDTLSKKFNAYYIFEQSGAFTSGNDPELNDKPILTGALKTNIFDNDSEKLAFLAGAYVRYGLLNDTAYLINIGNSLSKAAICYQLLKEFNCKPSYEILHNIPAMYHVYFHPNKKVKAYLEQFMYLRKRLDDSLIMLIEKRMSGAGHK